MTSYDVGTPETMLDDCLIHGNWPGAESLLNQGVQLPQHWFATDWPPRMRLPRSLDANCLALLEKAGSTICTVHFEGREHGILVQIARSAIGRCDLATVLYAALRGGRGFVDSSISSAFCARSKIGLRLSVARRVNFVETLLAIESITEKDLDKAAEELTSYAEDDPEEFKEPLDTFTAWRNMAYIGIWDSEDFPVIDAATYEAALAAQVSKSHG